ncbi:MAG: hypothetical protein EOP36_00595 [Rubrivivax sp.]|nr:MAG: hypothetical protein EOP36_00595 [Rubrivivax sp.]
MTLRSVVQTAALLGTTLWASAANSADLASVHEHRAACVAALTTKAEPLAAQLKSGDRSVEAELLGLTEKGFAIIGAAYKDGLRKTEADQLLASAKKAQKSMPAAELDRLQSSCQVEGAKVLTDVSGMERYLLTSAAERRVARILDKGKKR